MIQARLPILATVAMAGVLGSQNADREPRNVDSQAKAECARWLRMAGKEPGVYVVSKFANHDVVFLGENHEVKENCQFVSALIESLYKAGVRTLCTEFIPSRFNDRLAEIVTAKEYDEAAVIELFRRGPWPTWGYQEYVDIVRAAWSFNRHRSANADRFLIVGIDSDWKQVELLRTKSVYRTVLVVKWDPVTSPFARGRPPFVRRGTTASSGLPK